MNKLLVYVVAVCFLAQITFAQGNKHNMSISGTVSGATTAATLTISGTVSGTQVTDNAGNYMFPNLGNGSERLKHLDTRHPFTK